MKKEPKLIKKIIEENGGVHAIILQIVKEKQSIGLNEKLK